MIVFKNKKALKMTRYWYGINEITNYKSAYITKVRITKQILCV